MKTSIRRGIVPGIAALAVVLSACSAGNNSDAGGSDSAGGDYEGTLSGGGASSQEKAQNAWRAGFQTANSQVTINYDPVGSGDGRANFISGAYAFAGTDSALDDDEGELTGAQERCGGGNVIQVPAYVSPIAVVFNLPGIEELSLAPDVIADIFAGKITTWDDAAIAATNDGVDLPDTTISVVHRGDDSGTTENFTKYLQAAAPDAWTFEPDGVWPNELSGASGEGTSGMIDLVTQGEGSIGYADASATGDLGVVAVGVGEEFNAPSAAGAAQVVANSPRTEGVPETDMAIDLARDTTEAGSYPVLLVSYLVACETYEDAAQAELVKGYLTYVLSEDGQKAAEGEAGSAPLDSELAAEAQGLVDAISG
ncbi:phosphate ABC transporter substrate-binding protein PstS [Nocardioides sp. R-C-SC26]|uniref:phosphate ABC transporter substrate-binding protein PstS n=1 Tax=Nocardioides sp. R-C-SC26 TaxID=2870414 RepID=UPI001E2A6F4E|nr:phosphate ABC transporter substrate-binding protein PstS [Nocardioides sp. R-C-SC26]